MASSFLTVQVPFANKLTVSVKTEILKILPEIERRWDDLIIIQHSRLQNEWKPLNDIYLKRKEKEGYSSLILKRTGNMLSDYKALSVPNQLRVRIPFPTSRAPYDQGIKYSLFHHRGNGHLERRRFEQEEFTEISTDLFAQGIKNAISNRR